MFSRSLEAELAAMLGPSSAEYTIIGPDTRRRVTPTTVDPFRHVCQITADLPDPDRGGRWVQWVGSGTLISPAKVLTAAHVVFSRRYQVLARNVRVVPGKDGAGTGAVSEPYGAATGTRLDVPVGYRPRGANAAVVAANDYAVITLSARLSGRRPRSAAQGAAPLGFWRRMRAATDSMLRGAQVNNSGYPASAGGNLQYRAFNEVRSVSADRILYVNDTSGGQSGGPVWLNWEGFRLLVGVHTNGFDPANPAGPQQNSGVRLNATNLSAIRSWMRA